MKLPKCWSCKYVFKYRELFVLSFFPFKRNTCPNCGKRQHLAKNINWKINFLPLPIVFIPLVLNIFNVPWLSIGIIIIIALALYFAILPYQLKFSNKDHGLF
ncbi:TIGR04104 family putative zinc finger protein [Ornithinibacillus sp. 4-3]|uniref:TIGR04104 family putative zinc finger protein n=1 Tax=Ornithinibacillus sp. 4-3 TaxID=3231488 RepID=A0AB39HJT0_9BACI